ncbi:MAG: putative 4-hydroxybenzoate polyprenyltransferase [Campylobacterales bacterium]
MWRRLRDFSELVAFHHSIFSLPFILIAMIVAAKGWFGWKLFGLAIIAAVTARNFAMGVNRYLDRHFDRLNPRTRNRPSVDGRISERAQILFITINALTFVIIASLVNQTAFILSFPVLFILAFYSLVKRFSSTAHLFLGLALALSPLAGTIAVIETTPLWSWYLAGGVLFWVAGFDLLYAIQDIDFDRHVGLHSIPASIGVNKTLLLARLFHLLTLLLWTAFIIEINAGLAGRLGIITAAIMLAWQHRLVWLSLAHINKAFFTVNGWLGFIFLIFIIFDQAI